MGWRIGNLRGWSLCHFSAVYTQDLSGLWCNLISFYANRGLNWEALEWYLTGYKEFQLRAESIPIFARKWLCSWFSQSVAAFALFHVYAPYTGLWAMDGVDSISAVLWVPGGLVATICTLKSFLKLCCVLWQWLSWYFHLPSSRNKKNKHHHQSLSREFWILMQKAEEQHY